MGDGMLRFAVKGLTLNGSIYTKILIPFYRLIFSVFVDSRFDKSGFFTRVNSVLLNCVNQYLLNSSMKILETDV